MRNNRNQALKNKKILVGITGGIAAYKAAILVRLLIKSGADVRVVMTPYAKEFISPLTLSALSKHPVISDFFKAENGEWNSHVDTGLWADAFIIAPATANSMAKAAAGIADNHLLTVYLSARCRVFWAPAMDLDMFKHPTVGNNIAKLQTYGDKISEPESGELASGLEGKGRMAEPEAIFEQVLDYFKKQKKLKARILITAGPTQEKIDPVRYIGNRSSGKMGYALAEALSRRGADVKLISGPVNLQAPENIERISTESAKEMYQACLQNYKNADILIFAAAVADYTPEAPSDKKLKKTQNNLTIQLTKTPDIAAEIGKLKKDGQISMGFALETDNETENALKKRKAKNFDFIVLNSLQHSGAGFETDTNQVTVFDKNNKPRKFELKLKTELAEDLADILENAFISTNKNEAE